LEKIPKETFKKMRETGRGKESPNEQTNPADKAKSKAHWPDGQPQNTSREKQGAGGGSPRCGRHITRDIPRVHSLQE
jgi:hypothetical protein